jgi:hypothetical protein
MMPGKRDSTGTLTLALGFANASSIFFSQLEKEKTRAIEVR